MFGWHCIHTSAITSQGTPCVSKQGLVWYQPPLLICIKSLHSGRQECHLMHTCSDPYLQQTPAKITQAAFLLCPRWNKTVSLLFSKFPFLESPLKFSKGQLWTGSKRLPVLIYHWLKKYYGHLIHKSYLFPRTLKVNITPSLQMKKPELENNEEQGLSASNTQAQNSHYFASQ